MITELEKCALCSSKEQLERSHIIPKMVVKKLKETSTGLIRNTHSPNVTVQDSEKYPMLCGACEDLFSKYEKYFSDIMFQPFINKETIRYEYDERLFFFLTSLSWRSLYLDLLDFVESHVVGIDALECLINAEKTMREYLLKKREDIGSIEHHIFFFDRIESISGKSKIVEEDLKPHATFHRTEFSYTVCFEKEKTYATITNMMGLFVVTLYSKGNDEDWNNTQIYNESGVIEARSQFMQSVICNELEDIMIRVKNASESMSEKQKEKIKERIDKIGIDMTSSPVFQDWVDDAELKKG